MIYYTHLYYTVSAAPAPPSRLAGGNYSFGEIAMRMRFKPYARPELAAWPYFIDQPDSLKGHFAKAFADGTKPLRLELGCGKGGFLAQLALRDSQYNFLGVDIKSEVLVVAKRNIEALYSQQEQPLGNILITSHDIERIGSMLGSQDAVDRIYINFCNPWYKSGHAKHRLTHPRQLVSYRDILVPQGELWFKTDDDILFNDSLRYFDLAGYSIEWMTRDLHSQEPHWNIRTEHEEMFSAEGIPIKACIAKMKDVKLNKQEFSCLKDC